VATRRMLRAAVLGGILGASAVLGLAAPAQAHDAVIGSTPAEGEVLTALPDTFSVTASQTIVAAEGTEANFGLRITDAAGLFYQDGCVSIVDATMSTPAALGEAGDYTLTWQYVSSDGHPTSGAIPFTWQPPADFVPSAGSATPPLCGEAAAEEPSTATPEPRMTTQGEDPASSPAPTRPAEDDGAVSGTVLWLVGAVVAIVVAVGATLLFVRPGKPEEVAAGDPDGDRAPRD
jgi:methionine-rich copper-binding protein CopC